MTPHEDGPKKEGPSSQRIAGRGGPTAAYAGRRTATANSFGTRTAGRNARAGLLRAAPWRSPVPTAATESKALRRPASGRRSANARQASFSAEGDAPGRPPSGAEPVAAATATYACSPSAGSAIAPAPPARVQTTTGDHRRAPAQNGGRGTPTRARRKPRPAPQQHAHLTAGEAVRSTTRRCSPRPWSTGGIPRGRGMAPSQGADVSKRAKERTRESASPGRRAAGPTTRTCSASRSGASVCGGIPRRWLAGATAPNSERTG